MIAEHGKKPVPNNRKGRAFQVLQSAPQGGEQETERQVILKMIPAGKVLAEFILEKLRSHAERRKKTQKKVKPK